MRAFMSFHLLSLVDRVPATSRGIRLFGRVARNRGAVQSMAKQHLLMLGLIVGGTVAFQACSSDNTAGKAGTGNEAGAAGETGSGATGPSEAGTTGEAGAAGAAGAVSSLPPLPSLNPQAVIVTAAEPSSSNHLLVAGTDFLTSTEIASVALDTGKVDDTTTYNDGDAVATSSAGLGFAVERTNDKVHLLNGSKIATTFDLKDLGTGTDAAIANKAYVPLLNQSLVTVLDLKAGTVSKRIDLNKYNAAGDNDGSADIDTAVYDPAKQIAYFVLGRIDITTYDANVHLPCSATKALVVGIDAKTDAVVDLNGAADGEALELSLANPSSVDLAADGSLVVLSNGCYQGTKLKSSGIEVLDPTTGASTVAYVPKTDDYLGKLILAGGSNALLGTSDSTTFQSHWYKVDLSNGMLGEELLNVPDAVSFDGKDLLGVVTSATSSQLPGKPGAVVRYDISTGKATSVSTSSWAGDYSSAASSALVK